MIVTWIDTISWALIILEWFIIVWTDLIFNVESENKIIIQKTKKKKLKKTKKKKNPLIDFETISLNQRSLFFQVLESVLY